MKNKIRTTLFILFLMIINSCHTDISKKNFSNNELDMIIQEFTTARISQYLYESEEPKDNITLLAYLVKQHGYNYNHFIEKLQEYKPALFKKLFVKISL